MKPVMPLLAAALALFSWSCATVAPTKAPPEPASVLYLEGTVQGPAGNGLALAMKLPEMGKTPGSPVGEIAQALIRKSLIIEGMRTDVNGKPATVGEVRGATVTVALDKPEPLPAGVPVRLTIPKKTIAIVDFDVIRGREKDQGRVTLEGLTTALIDSGQFNVVERQKLKAVMNELTLSQSGLAREKPGDVLGKLMMADLLLTGTLAEVAGEWDIHLRLVNVRTSQAMSAIHVKTALLKASEIRDSGPFDETFESPVRDPSWIMVATGRTAPFFRTELDRADGSADSGRSMRIDYRLVPGRNPEWARIDNRKKRDLSLYDGIAFDARATETVHAQVMVMTSMPDDPNRVDAWTGFFEAGPAWGRIRIPFAQMVVARGWIKQGAAAMYGARPGDQVLRLERVEGFQIGLNQKMNGDVAGSLWVDGIRFYRD
ncbi:MAG TPA: CsgG/HfaB family protein [Syntrophales bacterium]|nr:CsgG/HfaB family protein [Syntrophales bacterium]HOS77325.1 CsgG/HfaB family protein [Syntrophales bacterium]HPB69954.1 CsgG/HfaB family protein [Syntrophales bacterium]HQN25108.1 CsgG/HfaB family protein [Syntrophales bacterium]HQP28146.1 CsgG/HfaB family protein [Syntrophales bacterium]